MINQSRRIDQPVKWSVFQGKDIDVLYQNIVGKLMIDPDYTTAPRSEQTRELMNVTAIIDNDPTNSVICNPGRNINMCYLAGELCFYLRGSDRLSDINHYSSFWDKVSDDGATVRSAYGKRIFFDTDNLRRVVKLMRDDPDTRKAVIPIYDKSDQIDSKDNPCTMFMQFFIRDKHMSMHVWMRSNDIWFGFPYDVPFFRLVHEIVHSMYCYAMAAPFIVGIGPYYHHATSMHAYERNWPALDEVLSYDMDSITRSRRPALSYNDIAEWFTWALESERILRKGLAGGIDLADAPTRFQQWLVECLI